MQSVSSRFWTLVAVFISYDGNHYTTGTSLNYMEFMLGMFIEKDFESEGRKKKKKIESIKIMIYVENIN